MLSNIAAPFKIIRDKDRCIQCGVCSQQCSLKVHSMDDESQLMFAEDARCVNCHRCVNMCPTQALTITQNPLQYRDNSNWSSKYIKFIAEQSQTGGVLLTGMGADTNIPILWDNLMLNASQVTNPSIDPLREPMELRTILGKKPSRLNLNATDASQSAEVSPSITVDIPLLFSAMSYGSISYNVHRALALASSEMGTLYNTGEGGLHQDLYKYGPNTIVQVASGRFGVNAEYLQAGAAVEIKVGQGAKPGIGGHLPGEKVDASISVTRMIPEGSDAISPAPHHDIYSIEDLRQLIYALKEATDYKKPIIVKISAVHNAPAIASGIVRAGADIIALDGIRGGTGAAPTMIRDNVGIPIELALAAVDQRLRDEGIRNEASILVAGGFRCSADVVKAIALGADAVYIGTSALIAVGCHLCQNCYSGKCNWGIATQDKELTKRVNPEIATERLKNLLRAWSHEIKEFLGSMGINSIESLRGNRLQLRAAGLSQNYLDILGVLPAGR